MVVRWSRSITEFILSSFVEGSEMTNYLAYHFERAGRENFFGPTAPFYSFSIFFTF